jgi:hypothetical protein
MLQNALFLIVLSVERNLLILKEEKTRAKYSLKLYDEHSYFFKIKSIKIIVLSIG